jgi:hypothetical protein
VKSHENLELIAIPTNQRAREDLVAIGEHIEKEKDRLLNVVSLFSDYLSLKNIILLFEITEF